ncbi:AMP-binding domain-containing protein [Aphelenchoides bicaudatus]|nr:AMP-binding domain-containing protein [Aphelenchoides bicaudatus]
MTQTEQMTTESRPKEGFIRSAIRKSFAFKKHEPKEPKQPELLCRILPGDERIHESSLVKEPTSVPLDDPEVRTLYDVLQRGMRVSNNGPYLGERGADGKYQWQDYKTVIENAQFVGSAIQHLGLKAGQDTRVAVAGLHSPEYITVGHALSSYSMVFVPLYYNYCFGDLMGIVNKCRIELMFCDNYKRAQEYISKSAELPTLKHIVLLKSGDSAENSIP